jgi:hypothetical protein
MIKRFIIATLMRMLDGSFPVDYKTIDKEALEKWAYRSFDDKGWRSYFGYEDLRILKELSFGKDVDTYHILIGRRLQLLYIYDEMRKAFENVKSREEKKVAQKNKELKT